MVYQVTDGVGIKVETTFMEDASQPYDNEFLFAYQITIENLSAYPVQLMHRHWDILDARGYTNVVDGEGVVGIQPIIEPGASYTYNSAVVINAEIGRMAGHYEMINLYNHKTFFVTIPEFQLVVPYMLN